MRTTLSLHDEILRRARSRAAREGKTLSHVVEDALRAWMTRPKPQQEAFHLEWEPIRGTAPPAVDVADRDRLYDYLENRR